METINFISEGRHLIGILRQAAESPTKAVVFCHDAFETQESWGEFVERFCETGITTLTFDFTGHGRSEGLRSLVDLRVWAHNIRDALNELAARGYQEFGLVGWGIGGTAALLAAAHDRRLRCVVTLATPVSLVPGIGERFAYGLISFVAKLKMAFTKKPLMLSRLNEMEEMHFVVNDEVNQAYISNPSLTAAYQAIPIPQSLDSVWFDITHMLEKISIPVLVLHGERDEIVLVGQGEKIITKLTGSKKIRVFEDCGHAMHMESHKEAILLMISKWIKVNLDPGNKKS
jgi:alpha-beta hydrolase superfamily lysophospholipase